MKSTLRLYALVTIALLLQCTHVQLLDFSNEHGNEMNGKGLPLQQISSQAVDESIENGAEDSAEEPNLVTESGRKLTKRDEMSNSKARNCRDCALAGLEENGHCTIYDDEGNKFTAYCDITSEPGYAWTLVTSFSRRIVRSEASQILKRRSLGDDGPVNQDTPNWVAFRYGKKRLVSLKEANTHFRFTCSEDGPFLELKNYNDYVRVKFANLDPLTLNVHHEKCASAEFFNVRNVSCVDCSVSFSQRRNVWSLHIDAWLAQYRCGVPRINDEAVHSEDSFGFYDRYNLKFTCTKYDWSTTQLWFGSLLHPGN